MAVVSRFPTTNVVDGSPNWTSPSNAHADDGVDATASSTGAGQSFSNLWGNFGFNALPPQAVIKSVKIVVEDGMTQSGTKTGELDVVALVLGTGQGAHVAGTAPETYPVTHTADITADRAWKRADLLDGVFEVQARFFTNAGTGTTAASLDYIRVDVDYYIPGSSIGYVDTANAGNGGTSVTINRPPLAAPGHLLVAVIWYSPVPSGDVTPAGWFQVQTVPIDATAREARVYRRLIGGMEPPSYVFAGGGSTFTFGYIDALSGVDPVQPEDVATPAGIGNSTSTTVTFPTIAPVTPGAWHLAIIASDIDILDVVTPLGYAMRGFGPVNTRASATYTRNDVSGSIALTTTRTSGAYGTISVALRPAVVVPPSRGLVFRRWPQAR